MSERAGTKNPLVGIMAKAPRAGHAKTRLTSALPPDVAADLYRHFLLDTLDTVRRVHGVTALLLCPRGDGDDLRRLAGDVAVLEQPRPGLMQGLAFGIDDALRQGHPAAALINADSPTLPPALIAEAFVALRAHDVVLGPTADGGYYLIAAAVPCTRLLLERPYADGTTILRDTVCQAARLGLHACTITPWFDIDLPAELGALVRALDGAPAALAPHTRRALDRHAQALERLGDGEG